MQPFKFSDTAAEEKPDTTTTRLLEKADKATPLTREEKDAIARVLYDTMGPGEAVYKLHGWAWYMPEARHMHEVLVENEHSSRKYRLYWAPDKTALRLVLSGGSKRKMVYPSKDK